ncbi:MAG: hypothetical protein IJ880_07605 [Bacilli bacterium]|nr:hypothetical protein [Bacilli bacterium]
MMKVLSSNAKAEWTGPEPIPVFMIGYCLKGGKAFMAPLGKIFRKDSPERTGLSLVTGNCLDGGFQVGRAPTTDQVTSDLMDIGVFEVPPHTRYVTDGEWIYSESLIYKGKVV